MSNSPACVFDAIIAGAAPAHVVLDEADVVAFLDRARYSPATPSSYPAGTTGRSPTSRPGWPVFFGTGRPRFSEAQRKALDSSGTFFGLNDIVSQSVPHVHLHVVPRRPKDGLRGFFWPRQRYASDHEAARTASLIRDALAG